MLVFPFPLNAEIYFKVFEGYGCKDILWGGGGAGGRMSS